jgi:hypothetical protein
LPTGELFLSWSSVVEGAALQYNAGLSGAASWNAVDVPASLRGGRRHVILPISGTGGYYRLEWPVVE